MTSFTPAVTVTNQLSGVIYHSEILLNPNCSFGDGASSAYYDMQSIIMHELGHTIGIAHCHQASDTTCFDPKCVAFGFGGNLNLSVDINIMNPVCSKNYTRRVFQVYDSSSYQLMYP